MLTFFMKHYEIYQLKVLNQLGIIIIKQILIIIFPLFFILFKGFSL